MKNIKAIIYFLITALLFLNFISGCGSENKKYKPEQQSVENEQKLEKIPEQLKTIENDIEKIFQYLNVPSIPSEENKNQSSSNSSNKTNSKNESTEGNQNSQGKDKSQETDSDNKDTNSDSDSGQNKSSNKQSQTQQQSKRQEQDEQEGQQERQPDPWEQISAAINDIHNQWNTYMPLAAKKNASANTIENFSNALNNLTNTATGKNPNNTMLAVNSLYSYIPDFYSLYRTETSPEIKKIRHYTRSIIINSQLENWTEADLNLNSLRNSWSFYKNILPQEMSDSANTLELSIYELEKVVKQKNKLLTEVKGKIVMNNIMEMEKALKKSKG